MNPIPLTDHAKQVLATKAAEQEAGALPLPGPIGDAFSTGPIQVQNYSVRKIVAYDWRTLQRLKNAVLEQLTGAAVEIDDDSQWQLIWVLTHTVDEVDAAIKAGGFDRLCRNEIGGLDVGVFVQLCEAVTEQIRRSVSTAVKYGAKEDEAEKKITQLASDTQRTALAGG